MLSYDVRLALRRFRARPYSTALLVLIVAVGIGASTAVFSVVDQTLLRQPPFLYPDRLVDVLDTNRKSGGGGNSLIPEKIAGWQTQTALFERFEAYAPAQFDMTGGGVPERIDGLYISNGLLSMLGVSPRLGREFAASEGRPGSPAVVLISDALWRRRFGAQPDAIGHQLVLNDQQYTVVGVMPRRFRLLSDKQDVLLPFDVTATLPETSIRSFYGIGRLSPAVQMAGAQQVANDIADRLQRETPLVRTWDLHLERKRVARVDPTTTTALYVLLGAVSFVLLITCANVANLFLVQAPQRLREMAIATALGSSRVRVIRSVLVESVLIASAGGALGVVVARWGLEALLAATPESLAFRTTTTVEVDGRVTAVATALTLVTGVVIGMLPAMRGSRREVESTLRGASAAARSAYGRAPAALIVVEVGFSVILLVGAALMARTLANLGALDPGFDAKGLVAMHVDLPSDRYPSPNARWAFYETVFERLRGVQGISDAAASSGVPPAQGGFSWGIDAEGGRVAPASTLVPFNTVTSGYFRTLGIPLVAGRAFTSREARDAAIVSQGFAERFWPGENAVGRRYRLGSNDAWRTIVGVVGNVETRAAGDERTTLQMYYPWMVSPAIAAGAQPATTPVRRTYDWRVLVVRTKDPGAAIAEIKRQIWSIDPEQPIDRIALVTDIYAAAFGRQRFLLVLMSVFSAIALALTVAGLSGVLAQIVARRTREIGVRVALGARPADVFRLVLSQGLSMALAGAVLGIGAALWLTRVLESLLFEVTPTDPWSFAAVGVLLGAVALVACWLPARAATRIEPAAALRVE